MSTNADDLLREAFAALAQEEADALETQMPLKTRRDAETLYRQHRATVRALIARHTKPERNRLRVFLRSAACVAAAAGILFFALRTRAPEAALNGAVSLPFSTFTDAPAPIVPLSSTAADINLQSWLLFPTYIPDGWALRAEAETDNGLTALFSTDDGAAWMRFSQADGSYLYPTIPEGAAPAYLRLNGLTALKLSGAQETTLVWDQDGVTLTLTGNSAASAELEKVAESVKKVTNE